MQHQVIYSSIIKGFAQAKQAEKCFRTLEEMEEQGSSTGKMPGDKRNPVLVDQCLDNSFTMASRDLGRQLARWSGRQ